MSRTGEKKDLSSQGLKRNRGVPGNSNSKSTPFNPFSPNAREDRIAELRRKSEESRKKAEYILADSNRSEESGKKAKDTIADSNRSEESRKKAEYILADSNRSKIGNHDWRWNFITLEDAKPFNDEAEFFSMSDPLFSKCSLGIDIKLNSQMCFENNSQIPIQEIENRSETGMFISECFRRVAKFIRPGPGDYKLMHKDHLSKLVGYKSNNTSKEIKEEEKEDIMYYVNEKHTKNGEIVDRVSLVPAPTTKRVGNNEQINFEKRAKFFKAAVIDTDGASLEKMFSQKNNTLEFGKINTNNGLLQNFFSNIDYWGTDDKKLLVVIHPNYESSIFNGIMERPNFDEIAHHIHPLTLTYGLEMPPFFRRDDVTKFLPIEDYLDQDPAIRRALERELANNIYATIQSNQFLETYRGEYPLSTTYAEHVYSSFYVSKNPRSSTKRKRKVLEDFCIPKSDKERDDLYKGNDFIQCYEIEKISDYEIKVERLKF